MKRNGIGSHQSAKAGKTEWLTPLELICEFPLFDLDPCSPINRPWDTAHEHYTIKDDGLKKDWFGMVWCNPPYDRAQEFLHKLKEHGNGIALIFARTETKTWFSEVWDGASAVLFIEGRLTFCHVSGEKAKANSGAPSALVSYGAECAKILFESEIKGKYINLE